MATYGWTLTRCSCGQPCCGRTSDRWPTAYESTASTRYAGLWRGARSWPRPSPTSWKWPSCRLTGCPLRRQVKRPRTAFPASGAGLADGGWPSPTTRSTPAQPSGLAPDICANTERSQSPSRPAIAWPGRRNHASRALSAVPRDRHDTEPCMACRQLPAVRQRPSPNRLVLARLSTLLRTATFSAEGAPPHGQNAQLRTVGGPEHHSSPTVQIDSSLCQGVRLVFVLACDVPLFRCPDFGRRVGCGPGVAWPKSWHPG
jgi:hypothetical protein